MLEIIAEYGIEDPIEAEDRVNYHGEVVKPYLFETEPFSKENVRRRRIEKTYRTKRSVQH